MKEWIHRFKSVYKEVQADVLAKFLSKRVPSDEETYLLRNQLPVRLMIGRKQHIPANSTIAAIKKLILSFPLNNLLIFISHFSASLYRYNYHIAHSVLRK